MVPLGSHKEDAIGTRIAGPQYQQIVGRRCRRGCRCEQPYGGNDRTVAAAVREMGRAQHDVREEQLWVYSYYYMYDSM